MSYKRKLTVIAITIISATSMPVFAWLDTIIQRVWESLRPKETYQNLQKWLSLGNIYSNSYQLAKKEMMAWTVQALQNMVSDLNDTYSCDMSVYDASNILLTIDASRNDIAAMASSVREAMPASSNEDFISSCTKLINCATNGSTARSQIYWFTGSLKWEQWTYLTEWWFINCRKYAYNAYERNVKQAKATITLASTNVGSDIYYNGTLNDSPYDLLVDIQRIWDVLFATNEKTPNVLFYTFPSNSIAWLQAIPFDWSSRFTNNPASIPLNNSTNNQTNTTQNSWLPINNTQTSFPTTSNTNNWWSSSLQQWWYNDTLPIYISSDTSSNNTIWWVIDNFACLPADSWWDWNNIWGWSNTWNPSTWWENTWDSWIIIQDDGTTNIGTMFNINTPYYSPIVSTNDDPINDNNNWESPEWYEAQAAVIASCTSKCSSLPAIDKAMCISKCMCWTTYTKNGMFWLSICTVPTKQTDIVSSKSVQSVEEILTEINNVLTTLKNSGEMMKHTKPKEFLDTSLSKIKLNKTFAFDISVSFKPVLDAKPRRMSEAEVENNTDTILKWTYGSIDIWAEKNKYIVFGNNEDIKVNETQKVDFAELQKEITNANATLTGRNQWINTMVTESIAKSQNAEVTNIMRQFLEQNIRFWWFVHESLIKTQETADALRQKIEKGN